MPDRFDNIISALDAQGNERKSFTFDLVKSRFLHEEQRINDHHRAEKFKSEAAALVSNHNRGNYHPCDNFKKLTHPSHEYRRKFPEIMPYNIKARRHNYAGNHSAFVAAKTIPVKPSTLEDDYICLLAGSTTSKSGTGHPEK